MSGKCTGHSDALLLATGELGWVVTHPMRHSHSLERFHHSRLALGGGHFLAVSQREFDIFVHRKIANQIETLEDESNFLVANAGTLRKIQILDRLRIQAIAAAGGSIEQTNNREQRRLAAARGAGHGDVLPFRIDRCTPESAWVSTSSV